jgi:hypothetical protein
MAKFNFKKVTDGLVNQMLPAAAGGVASLAIAKVIPSSISSKISPKLMAIGKMGLGAILPVLMPKQKMAQPFAQGFVAVAAADLAAELMPALVSPKVSGIGEVAAIEEEYILDNMSGVDDDVISGTDDDVISGTDDVTY